MNESTNIVTVRKYNDGSRSLTINGRDIPDVIDVAHHSDGVVVITMQAAQINVLQGDETQPPYEQQVRLRAQADKRGVKAWWLRVVGRR